MDTNKKTEGRENLRGEEILLYENNSLYLYYGYFLNAFFVIFLIYGYFTETNTYSLLIVFAAYWIMWLISKWRETNPVTFQKRAFWVSTAITIIIYFWSVVQSPYNTLLDVKADSTSPTTILMGILLEFTISFFVIQLFLSWFKENIKKQNCNSKLNYSRNRKS